MYVFIKGRVQFATMNTAVEELNTALEDKYTFMARTFANMTSRLLHYKIVKKIEGVQPSSKTTKKCYASALVSNPYFHILSDEF